MPSTLCRPPRRCGAALFFVFVGGLSACVTQPTAPSDVGAESEDIRREIGSHLSEIQPCYELAIDAVPGAAGKMLVRFLIVSDGSVRDAEVRANHPTLKAAEECVLNQVRAMRFTPRSEEGELEILYPFYFTENGRLPPQP